MAFLVMDTAHAQAYMALVREEKVDGMRLSPGGKLGQSRFAQDLHELMEEGGVAFSALEGIIVGSGPGSYTGVRKALALAKGFHAILGVPLYPVSSLYAYPGEGEFIAAFDARAGGAWVAEGVKESEGIHWHPPTTLSLDGVRKKIEEEGKELRGPDTSVLLKRMGLSLSFPDQRGDPLALASQRPLQPVDQIEPLYLRGVMASKGGEGRSALLSGS